MASIQRSKLLTVTELTRGLKQPNSQEAQQEKHRAWEDKVSQVVLGLRELFSRRLWFLLNFIGRQGAHRHLVTTGGALYPSGMLAFDLPKSPLRKLVPLCRGGWLASRGNPVSITGKRCCYDKSCRGSRRRTFNWTVLVSVLLVSSCTHPAYVERMEHSASVQIENASTGYSNLMTYRNSQTCEGPQVLGTIFQPNESRVHQLSAGESTTVSVAAWGLPSEPQMVSWCPPIFLSFKLIEGHSYRLRFAVDYSAKKCAVQLIDRITGSSIPTAQLDGTGGLFPGIMAGPISCKPKQGL